MKIIKSLLNQYPLIIIIYYIIHLFIKYSSKVGSF